jgi:hypothetical protein
MLDGNQSNRRRAGGRQGGQHEKTRNHHRVVFQVQDMLPWDWHTGKARAASVRKAIASSESYCRASEFVKRGIGFQPVSFIQRVEYSPPINLLKPQIMLRGSIWIVLAVWMDGDKGDDAVSLNGDHLVHCRGRMIRHPGWIASPRELSRSWCHPPVSAKVSPSFLSTR